MATQDSLSPSQPVCPRCRTDHSADSACPAAATQSTPGPLTAQAETLFESYLAARLVRSRRNLTVAKVTLMRDPRSREKRDALLRAEAETEKLKNQLLEQTRRAAQMREQVKAAEQLQASLATPSAQPTEDFRALQSAKADITLRAREEARSYPDDRVCPSCGNRMAGETTVCNCGHRFADSDARAEPFLSDAELAALRGSPKLRE